MRQSKRLDINSSLPIPDPNARSHSEKLTTYIKNLIDEQAGTIGFDEYMNTVLYQPGLGYYSAGCQKFGSDGDFVTAPEVSKLFSKCLASQCSQILDDFEESAILEIGAGTGVMARDLLLDLDQCNSLPDKYYIFEISADLKQKQQRLLKQSIPKYIDNIIWLDTLPEAKIKGLIIANEVLDALPVKRFKKESNLFKEVKVTFSNNKFCWTNTTAEPELLDSLMKLEKQLPTSFPNNYYSEKNINLKIWLDSVQSVIEEGVILFIDYGYAASDYYHPNKSDGNLLCHYQHNSHNNPFFYPGLQDITSSVDFTAVAQYAEELGLHVKGYNNQTYFLFGCGLEDLIPDMDSLDIKSQVMIAQQLRMLTMPDEMGERFKVIALAKKYNKKLLGFSIMNQRNQL